MKIDKRTMNFCFDYLGRINSVPFEDLDLSDLGVNLSEERRKELAATGLNNVNILNSNLIVSL